MCIVYPIDACTNKFLFGSKGEVAGGSSTCSALVPVLELPGNPSSFAVYANVRGLVLENAARQAQGVYLATTQPPPSDSDTDDEGDKAKEHTMQIPKVCNKYIFSCMIAVHLLGVHSYLFIALYLIQRC